MTDETLVDIAVDREETSAPASSWFYGVNPAGGGADFVISKENLITDVSKNFVRQIHATVGYPGGYYTTVRAQIPLFRASAALTITRIHIQGPDSTPTAEFAGDLKYADDIVTGSFANAVVIDVCDTTNGTFTATSSFDDATVPSGKWVYLSMDSAPHADWTDLTLEVYYTYD